MTTFQARSRRGALSSLGSVYGKSVLGAPLLYFPAERVSSDSGLVIAGTHGDETASVVALSCALRTLASGVRRHHVILAVNPDGCQLGLRANANGVDVNRNFPAANWQAGETVYRWTSETTQRDVLLSTGAYAGSEPETSALCQLITQLNPPWVVSFHEPLACVEQATREPLAVWLAARLALPLVDSVGYATPGSFGSWCEDRRLPCITVELPAISADAATSHYLDALVDLLDYPPTLSQGD
ncbi:murein tripeptide amidase MpaA [Acerihabitans sp. TG2]|uniref:murein tripeptide amidase MpaA n=1 Tax=Acerihabitans sp. TG2 TaxID=3096008 RepID=UPI002B228683|nr:murein tripeptide amidase MpaA [Acerihabitans sp. TG2]MEA9389385.1 murein tripeptide amidase MpaA [Acerihabitans sp. TG2]